MQPVGLCGVPFRELQEQAAQVLAKEPVGRLDSPVEEEEGQDQHTQLWVDKYKPR
jgi:hypothetical protein